MPLGDAVDFALVAYTVADGDAVNFEFAPVVVAPFLIGFGVSGRIGKEGQADPLNVNGIWQMRMTKK